MHQHPAEVCGIECGWVLVIEPNQQAPQAQTLAILCTGAWLVMHDSNFTVGMLVAFQMFSGRLSGPVLRRSAYGRNSSKPTSPSSAWVMS